MADPVLPSGPNPGRPVNAPEGPSARPASREAGQAEESPAFQVLLERLQQQARTLAEQSQSIGDPEELSGAVDAARASLDDAVSLSEQLLEAYREAQHRPSQPESDTPNDEREESR